MHIQIGQKEDEKYVNHLVCPSQSAGELNTDGHLYCVGRAQQQQKNNVLRFEALYIFPNLALVGKKPLKNSTLFSDRQRTITQYCAW